MDNYQSSSAKTATWAAASIGVSTGVVAEVANSGLPGSGDGPADAYRHLILSAEMSRKFGAEYTNYILNAHENLEHPDAATLMDLHNNQLGIDIGKTATSWKDVLQKARDVIDATSQTGVGAMWLPESAWSGSIKPESGRTPDNPNGSMPFRVEFDIG
jgi:hypothetical protein